MTPKQKKDKREKAFNNWTYNKIHLTFPNGNSISTVWGCGTYSDNHGTSFDNYKEFMQSNEVEIMILDAPDKLVKKIQKKFDFAGDSVKGYLAIQDWLKILNMLSK